MALVTASLAGCGASSSAQDPRPGTTATTLAVRHVCAGHRSLNFHSRRVAYAAVVRRRAVAFRKPGKVPFARFGRLNVNGVPTVFAVLGVVGGGRCSPAWYRVQLPRRPNGITGYVRAAAVDVEKVNTRIEVDVSARRLTFYRKGRRVLSSSVAVGAPATPTPIGRFYVNQRLVPTDKGGPFGPAALGVSAFSPVLTNWVQGGPVGIHGTNEPWSIGHAVSNGCIRLPNAVLQRVFTAAPAGTPVVIHP
jgi:hypothetical protein